MNNEKTFLMGQPIQLVVWDGTEEQPKNLLPMIPWFNVSQGEAKLLRFPLRVGNGSIPIGGYLLVFQDRIVEYGAKLIK